MVCTVNCNTSEGETFTRTGRTWGEVFQKLNAMKEYSFRFTRVLPIPPSNSQVNWDISRRKQLFFSTKKKILYTTVPNQCISKHDFEVNAELTDTDNLEIFGNKNSASKQIKIIIKTLSSRQCTINIDHNALIGDVKKIIDKKMTVPPEQQRLIFAGRQLEDGKTLSEYNIHNDTIDESLECCTLHMVVNLRGGMYSEASGYDNTTGKFLFYSVKVNDLLLNYHPCWTIRELTENVKEALLKPNPESCIFEKAKATALKLYRKEIGNDQSLLDNAQHVLDEQKKAIQLMEECESESEDVTTEQESVVEQTNQQDTERMTFIQIFNRCFGCLFGI